MANIAEEPFDVNFCYPVRELQSSRVKLTPFVPALHAEAYFQGTHAHPEVYKHFPIGPWSSTAEFVHDVFETRTQPDSGIVLFALLEKQSDSSVVVAGMIGLMTTDIENSSTEIGFVLTLPAFHRRGLTMEAIALLLNYTLSLPTEGGLGLRRVVWRATSENVASNQVAQKMGFKREAVSRYGRLFPMGKGGQPGRDGEPEDVRGRRSRDVVIHAVCWDDWEDKVKERVKGVLGNGSR